MAATWSNPCTPVGRRRGHSWHQTHEHHNQQRAKLQDGRVDLERHLQRLSLGDRQEVDVLLVSRYDVVDLHAGPNPLSQSRLSRCKAFGVSNDRIVLQQMVQSDDVEIARWRRCLLGHGGSNGCHLEPSMHTCSAQPQEPNRSNISQYNPIFLYSSADTETPSRRLSDTRSTWNNRRL